MFSKSVAVSLYVNIFVCVFRHLSVYDWACAPLPCSRCWLCNQLMLQVLERAASRALEASQHFERAASVRLDSLDRSSGRQRSSLDLAINQVLQGMGHSTPSIPEQSPKVSPVKGSPSRSRFAVEAVAASC